MRKSSPHHTPLLSAGQKKTNNVELRAAGRDFWVFADPTPALLQSRAGGMVWHGMVTSAFTGPLRGYSFHEITSTLTIHLDFDSWDFSSLLVFEFLHHFIIYAI